MIILKTQALKGFTSFNENNLFSSYFILIPLE